MFTKPAGLDERELSASVRRWWEIEFDELTYSPVGFGSHHWTASGPQGKWFVTVDDLGARSGGASDPRDAAFDRVQRAFRSASLLAQQGLGFVVAPVADASGQVLHRFDDRYSVVIHPFVTGTVPDHQDGAFVHDEDRHAVLGLVAQLHSATDVVADIAVRDDLTIPLRVELLDALERLHQPWDTGPYGDQARLLLSDHAAVLEQLIPRFDGLAALVGAEPDRQVITHGEPSALNTMIVDGAHRLVDWESARLAAPERDLWDLDPGDGSLTAQYEHETGTVIQGHALDAYRLWYDLFEIAGYIELFRHPHDDTADAAASWKNLRFFLRPRQRWPHLL